MAKKTLTVLKGSKKVYDLDKIAEDSRTNSALSLIPEIWEWDPNSSDPTKRNPNPPNLQNGRLWISKKKVS